jgi:hypothetical protein
MPTLSNPLRGKRTRYWVRAAPDVPPTVFRGGLTPPTSFGLPDFYINGGRVFRDNGYPDGPSSVPYYVIRGRAVYPSEGFPTGADAKRQFDVMPLRRYGFRPVIRINPRARDDL